MKNFYASKFYAAINYASGFFRGIDLGDVRGFVSLRDHEVSHVTTRSAVVAEVEVKDGQV